jgi:uncharacterized membrane protein YdbT with pleckstrin-like domain
MMSYVSRVLQPGEQVRHTAELHWILYLPGLLLWVLGGIILILVPDPSTHWLANRLAVIAAWICFAIGAVQIAWAWFVSWITEIAVTNRRVIYKTGFIRRDTIEINMDKVESVEVRQSILGRILDYGHVYVRGTGQGDLAYIKFIAAPIELRNQIIAT